MVNMYQSKRDRCKISNWEVVLGAPESHLYDINFDDVKAYLLVLIDDILTFKNSHTTSQLRYFQIDSNISGSRRRLKIALRASQLSLINKKYS